MWIGSYTARIGSWDIGVRVDDVVVQELLLGQLGDALHPTESPPPGYAVVTTNAGSNGVGRELPSLRFGHSTVFRSRSPMRLAHALVNHLLSYREPPAGTLRLRTAAVAREGSAVLLPDALIWAAGRERQLDRLNLAAFDSPVVDVDESGMVRLTHRVGDDVVRSATMEVAAWLIPGHLLGGMDPKSRSSILAAAANLIDVASLLSPQTALSSVAALLPLIEPVGADWSLDDLADSPR